MKQNSKLITFLLAGFIAFQLFFIYKRVHNYPFMIYDMYSRPEQVNEYADHYRLIADKDTINLIGLPVMKEGLIINSLKQYDDFMQDGRSSWESALDHRQKRLGKLFGKVSNKQLRYAPEKVNQYPQWLKNYLERHVVKGRINELLVLKSTVETKYGLIYKEKEILRIE